MREKGGREREGGWSEGEREGEGWGGERERGWSEGEGWGEKDGVRGGRGMGGEREGGWSGGVREREDEPHFHPHTTSHNLPC